MEVAVQAMVFLGSALMVYNIYCFVRYARHVQGREDWGADKRILYIPVLLLVSFLLGYLAVGLFGKPDLIVAGILFGGSIFVFVMHRLLFRITDRIVRNEQLAAQLTAAEESNRAKLTFMASISHEMRTPMNVILGLDRLALAHEGLSDELRDQLERIGLSAQHLLDLINNIIQMNELEAGGRALAREEFSLGGTLDQLDALISTLCAEKGLSYQSRRDDGIAEAVIGDEMALKQALISMLDNAMKYTDPPGTVEFATELVSREESSQVLRFVVKDSGVGMSEDFLPHVFDAFSQEDSSSTSRFGGGGLSLAVAKGALEQMGGTMEAASKKGEGSTFTATASLELASPTPKEAPGEPCDPAAQGPSDGGLDGRRILVVDDLDANAEIVSDLLELEDATSEWARDGRMAVDMVASSGPGHYDAVLMDLRMPVMDGYEAARRIRALDRADAKLLPIIALSANASADDLRMTTEAGMDAHLAKPIDADMLYQTLGKLIYRPSAGSESRIEGQG